MSTPGNDSRDRRLVIKGASLLGEERRGHLSSRTA